MTARQQLGDVMFVGSGFSRRLRSAIARGLFVVLHWVWRQIMAPKYFQIANLATPADGTRVKLVAPIDCSHIVIRNGDPVNPLTIETDPNNATERQVIAGGQELDIRSNAPTFPWPAGTTVAHVAASTGGPAIVRYTR